MAVEQKTSNPKLAAIADDLSAISVWHDSENPSRMVLGALASRSLNFINEQAAEIERLMRELERSLLLHRFNYWHKEADRLRDALDDLVSWQNGPPLSTSDWVNGWTRAYDKAVALLERGAHETEGK